MDIFWKICIDTIDTYLKAGYDVIFNYIILPVNFNILKEKFKNYNIKFVVLLFDEKIIIERDNCRPTDCQILNILISLSHNIFAYIVEFCKIVSKKQNISVIFNYIDILLFFTFIIYKSTLLFYLPLIFYVVSKIPQNYQLSSFRILQEYNLFLNFPVKSLYL